jgi:hypothetical protein
MPAVAPEIALRVEGTPWQRSSAASSPAPGRLIMAIKVVGETPAVASAAARGIA